MTKVCAGCGREFETNRSDKRYCGDTCRQRGKNRGADSDPIEAAATPVSRLVEVVERDLAAAAVLDSISGAIAVELAAALASPYSSPSAKAGLSREFTRVMDAALGSAAKPDLIDELKRRRDRKRGLS